MNRSVTYREVYEAMESMGLSKITAGDVVVEIFKENTLTRPTGTRIMCITSNHFFYKIRNLETSFSHGLHADVYSKICFQLNEMKILSMIKEVLGE